MNMYYEEIANLRITFCDPCIPHSRSLVTIDGEQRKRDSMWNKDIVEVSPESWCRLKNQPSYKVRLLWSGSPCSAPVPCIAETLNDRNMSGCGQASSLLPYYFYFGRLSEPSRRIDIV